LIYPVVYFLLIPTRLSSYIISICPPLLLQTFGAGVDALTRGTTVSSLPLALTASTSNLWSTVLLSGIAVCGGGWLIQGLGLNEEDWKLGMPSILNGGLWGTLDLWGGMGAGLLYSALRGNHGESRHFTNLLAGMVPRDEVRIEGKELVGPEFGRALIVLFLGGLLVLRVWALAWSGSSRSSEKGKNVIRSTEIKVTEKTKSSPTTPRKGKGGVSKSPGGVTEAKTTPRKVKEGSAVSASTDSPGGTKSTPRKSPRVKSK
jgi:hypothetical protein